MYKKSKRKSGLRVILSPLKETKTLTLSLICGVGSRHEKDNVAGISHFVEHMMFKGTKSRPTTLDISKELDGVGAVFNAYTSKDHTNYYIKIDASKVELAFDILSDMLLNSTFDKAETKKEQGVILEELKMYEDSPIHHIEDLFENLLFAKHNLGKFIIGTRKSIQTITGEKIKEYFAEHYNPNNMVLSVAGKFEEAEINKLIDNFFKFGKTKKVLPLDKFKISQTKPETTLMFKKTEQVHLALGFPAFGYDNKNTTALSLLSIILGGNMSSRLFINIREKQGLCYYIKASTNYYQDSGNLMVQSGLDKNRITKALDLIIDELIEIKEKGITEEELKRAQDFLIGHLVIQMEDSENIANYVGRQEILTGKIITLDEKIAKIKKVTTNEINKIAKEVIKKEKLNLAIIGPFKNVKVFRKIVEGKKF
jgi:predicted Zn-dependent peptidase